MTFSEQLVALVRASAKALPDVPVVAQNRTDKETWAQNWILDRAREAGLDLDVTGRNTWPDLRSPGGLGVEVKGLHTRAGSFDANSHLPTGGGPDAPIYYAFVRRGAFTSRNRAAVKDVVILHGDVLGRPEHTLPRNHSVQHAGSYGDTLVRVRKMLVCPTPRKLFDGLSNAVTLIAPADMQLPDLHVASDPLTRAENDTILVGVTECLMTGSLTEKRVANPHAGRTHEFLAWRPTRSSRTVASVS